MTQGTYRFAPNHDRVKNETQLPSRVQTLAPISPVEGQRSVSSTFRVYLAQGSREGKKNRYHKRGLWLICTKTNKWVVLQKRSSGSILVRVGITALPSIAVTSAGTLRVIQWDLYCNAIIWLFQATVSTLAIATASPLPHGEENTDNEKKTENEQPDDDTDDGTRNAFRLRNMSEGGG